MPLENGDYTALLEMCAKKFPFVIGPGMPEQA
jgi:hypothetical protein